MEKQNLKSSQFATDVYKGLTSQPKKLNSKYFYNQNGNALFEQITKLPEYYLTRKELEIIQNHRTAIAELFDTSDGFELIELGAGNGSKTKILLRHFLDGNLNFEYHPTDISSGSLNTLLNDLKAELPALQVEGHPGTYNEILDQFLNRPHKKRRVFLFLGSNIGNFNKIEAIYFLKKLNAVLKEKDLLFFGFDLKKDPVKIRQAYDDASGVTQAFNKNLLTRMNHELKADFDPDAFLHWPVYNPQNGTLQSFLVSTKKQQVALKSLSLEVTFEAWESIHTEISQKYSPTEIESLAAEAACETVTYFNDTEDYFRNYVFQKNKALE